MKDTAKGSVMCLIVIAIGAGVAFLSPWVRLQVMRIYGTQIESVRTDIYRESKSYVEGTTRDLRELRVEYEKAGEGHKEALRGLILQRAGELDYSRLPNDLRTFLMEIEE